LLLCALAAAILVGLVLRTSHLADVTSRSPDERAYTYYAGRIADGGLGVTPALFREYESDSRMWSYPVPNRITYVLLTAVAMKIGGGRDASAGVAVSCLFSCLSLVLLAWMGVRFFNRWIALAAVTFQAFSMCELAMAQRAWQDATFGFFGLLLLCATFEVTRQPRRISLYAAFFGLGALSMLTKQTGVITYALCALWIIWRLLAKERSWKRTALVVLGGLASIALCIGAWSILAGSTGVALSALNHSLHPGEAGRAYVEAVSSGPWHQFPYLLWIVSPLTALLTVVGLAVAIVSNRLLEKVGCAPVIPDACAAGCAALTTLGFVAFASFVPGMQNLRYICPASGAYCLLAGLGLWYLVSLARQSLPATAARTVFLLAVVAVVIGAVRDYRAFSSVVVASGMQDLPVAWIRKQMGH
jgi:4-amino-4-deoxy-L-arabinose transferase-like glycosyltransferase